MYIQYCKTENRCAAIRTAARRGQGRERERKGGGKKKEEGIGEGIIVLEDCQLRTLDPPLNYKNLKLII